LVLATLTPTGRDGGGRGDHWAGLLVDKMSSKTCATLRCFSVSLASLVTNIVGTFNASRRACWPRTRPSHAGSTRSASNFLSSVRKASDIDCASCFDKPTPIIFALKDDRYGNREIEDWWRTCPSQLSLSPRDSSGYFLSPPTIVSLDYLALLSSSKGTQK